MNRNLKLVINNSIKNFEEKYFFEKNELKIILDLYAKMVSAGSWKDYGLILLIICLFTGILAPMALIKWGLIAWVAANLWKRWKA